MLPVEQFPIESFAQANPFVTGFMAGNQAIQSALQTKYMQPMLQAQLAYQQQMAPHLQAQTQDILSGQLPLQQAQTQETLQGRIPLEQAQAVAQRALPGLYGSQEAANYARVPLMNAQAQLAQAQIPYVPLQAQSRYMMALGRIMPYTQIGLTTRAMNNPAFNALVSSDPSNAQKFTNIMQSILNGQIPGIPFNMTTQTNSATPQEVNAVQQAAGSDYLKKVTPQNILNQRYYEQSVDNLINNVTPEMPMISQFAGAAGKAKMSADKFAASAGLTASPEYQAFLNFTRVQAPLITNEIRRAYGGQATDSEQRIMSNLTNPTYWSNNPELATSQWNALISALKSNAGALSQSPFQNLQNTINSANGVTQPPMRAPAAGGRVSVIAPNGQRGTISAANLQSALASGYKVA